MDKPKGKDYTNWAVLGLAIATALIIFTIVVKMMAGDVQSDIWIARLIDWWGEEGEVFAGSMAVCIIITAMYTVLVRKVTVHGIEGSCIPFSVKRRLIDAYEDDSDMIIEVAGFVDPIRCNKARWHTFRRHGSINPGPDCTYVQRGGFIVLESRKGREVYASEMKEKEIDHLRKRVLMLEMEADRTRTPSAKVFRNDQGEKDATGHDNKDGK